MLHRVGLTGVFVALSVSFAAAADMPKLHPIEALCVTYEMSGQMMEGDSVQCHRHYANESYQIQNTTIKIPGMTQTQSQTTVTIGPDIYAIGDRCSHAEASLAEGEVFDGEVECPRHGAAFSLSSGEALTLPATQQVPTYKVDVEDDVVYLTIDEES